MEIKFDNVSFVIDAHTPLEKTILENVSFELKEKNIYSFVGASNSGKTAIADLINALVIPTKGRVIVGKFINDGRKIRKIKELRKEIGYIFKNPYDMFFNSTVKKELLFSMKYFRYKNKYRNDRIKKVLKLVNLDENILDINPQLLTLRDAKKVALACLLTYNPDILILDEFTNGLTVKDKKELINLLKLLKEKYNKTIILLTKDTSFAYEVTDYIYLMHKAKIIEYGKKDILKNVELLETIDIEPPKIVSFIKEYNKKGENIDSKDINEIIKEVTKNVF